MMNNIIFFSASWCKWCKEVKPIIDQYPEIHQFDVDTDRPFVKEVLKIKSIPTLIVFKDGIPVARWNTDEDEDTPVEDFIKLHIG